MATGRRPSKVEIPPPLYGPAHHIKTLRSQLEIITTRYQTKGGQVPAAETELIAQALGHCDHLFHDKLDIDVAKNLAYAFSRSEPCPAQARGFYVLAECVHVKAGDELPLRRLKQKAKRELGALSMTNLLAWISEGSHPEMISKSMSVFALELLENCQENSEVLRDSLLQDTLPNFYRCFLDTSNEMLRILIGCVLHRLLSHNMPLKLFFPDVDDPEPFEGFPCSRSQDAEWFASLAEHIEDLASESLLSSRGPGLSMSSFASSFSSGSHYFNVQNQSVIIVTVSDFLNVFIQTSPCHDVQCIEIPLHAIAHLRHTKSIQTGNDNEHRLEIRIKDSSDVKYFLNGKGFFDTSAEIGFGSETSEVGLQKLLQLTGNPVSVDSTGVDPPSMTSMTTYPSSATKFNTLASRVAPLRNSSQDLKRPGLIQTDPHSQPEARLSADKQRHGYVLNSPVGLMPAHLSKRILEYRFNNDNNKQREAQSSDGAYTHMTNFSDEVSHVSCTDDNRPAVEDLQNVHEVKHTQVATNGFPSVDGGNFSTSAFGTQGIRNDINNAAISKNGVGSQLAGSSGTRRLPMQTGIGWDNRVRVDGADQDEWDVPGTPRRLPNQMKGLVYASERANETNKFSQTDMGPAEASDKRPEQATGSKQSLATRNRRSATEKVSKKIRVMLGQGVVEDVDEKTSNSASLSRKLVVKAQTAKNEPKKALASSNKAVSDAIDAIESVEGSEASKSTPKIVCGTVNPAHLLLQNPSESIDRSQSPQGDAVKATEAAGIRFNKEAILVDRSSPEIVQNPSTCGFKRRSSSIYAQEESPTLPVDGCPEGEQADAIDPDKAATSCRRCADRDSRIRINRTVGSRLQRPSLDSGSLQFTALLPSKMERIGQSIANAPAKKEMPLSERPPARALVQKCPTTLVERSRTVPDLSETAQKEVAFRIRSPLPRTGLSLHWHGKKLQNRVTGRQPDPFSQRLKALSGHQNPFNRLTRPGEGGNSPFIAGDEEIRKSLEPNDSIPSAPKDSAASANLKLVNPERRSGTPCSNRRSAVSLQEGARLIEKRVPGYSGNGETTPIAIPRKQPIISFSKSGPRNQGTSKNRYRRDPNPQANTTLQHDDIESFITIPGDLTYSRVAKVAQMIEGDKKGSCSPLDSTLHLDSDDQEPQHVRICSQQTRVTNEGSPMPVIHSHAEAGPALSPVPVNYFQPHASVEYASSPSVYQKQTALLPNAISNPSSELVSLFKGPYSRHSYPKNRKQQPSSPREAAETACLPVHHFDNSGVIFNPATEETIVPLQPLDPFTGDSRNSATSFIRMLRVTGENSRKPLALESAPERTLKRKASHLEDIHEDPDKTLVASPPPLKDQDLSLSDSTSALGAGGLENQDINTRRTQILPKHQQGIKMIFSETTNRLLTRLVRGEESFMDIVGDYRQKGNVLVDQFHHNCQANVDSHKATVDAVHTNVMNIYQEIIEDLEITSKNIKGRAEALETAWGKSQTNLNATTDSTLAKFRTY